MTNSTQTAFLLSFRQILRLLLSFTLHIAPSELILQHRTQNATLKQFHNTTLEEMP